MGEFEQDHLRVNEKSISHGENAQSSNSVSPPPMQLQAKKENSNTQSSSNAPTASFDLVAQKQSDKINSGSLSTAEAKAKIIEATDGWGTDEAAVYSAIRKCNNRNGLKSDSEVMNALRGDMEGHELWKCYLLLEYGSESNYPSPMKQIWNATYGAGTDEDAVFAALGQMDTAQKQFFGLVYILRWELSGDDLQKAMDLIVTQDTIEGNKYGTGTDVEDLVITEDSLRELIDSKFVGAGSGGLKTAMMTLYDKPGGAVLNEALAQVESIRGMTPGSALGQYSKAMAKQTAGVDYYKKHKEEDGHTYDHAKDNPSPRLDTSEHPDFTGSNAQLRFGKILGDVFGMDAVFGSLISPTGGMAGPGNERIPLIEDGGAVATHGAIHDAAGYLYNCHGIGPGYDYLGNEPGADPSNPLAGQTNTAWWINEYEKRGKDVGYMEYFLASKAYIGAAFAKIYSQLNIDQKKNALKVMCETNTLTLKLGGISNTDRVTKVRELMDASSSSEKTILADYYYNNDTFGSVFAASELNSIMKPHVTQSVYDDYIRRIMERNDYISDIPY